MFNIWHAVCLQVNNIIIQNVLKLVHLKLLEFIQCMHLQQYISPLNATPYEMS